MSGNEHNEQRWHYEDFSTNIKFGFLIRKKRSDDYVIVAYLWYRNKELMRFDDSHTNSYHIQLLGKRKHEKDFGNIPIEKQVNVIISELNNINTYKDLYKYQISISENSQNWHKHLLDLKHKVKNKAIKLGIKNIGLKFSDTIILTDLKHPQIIIENDTSELTPHS